MKLDRLIKITIVLGIVFNFINYYCFLNILSILWYIASILIIYLASKLSFKYKFLQLNIKKLLSSLKSKSTNEITPLGSLSLSLAAKIGVGSLSGVALAIYFGGIGVIFWLIVISIFISINVYIECVLGIKYRDKYVGGPSYYIRKCLGNYKLANLYRILVIICYSFLFLSIQSNTIIKVSYYLNINRNYFIFILLILIFIIIFEGVKVITKVSSKLVPMMLIIYLLLGIIVLINNYALLPKIMVMVIREAFNIRSLISVFLIGMQRAIFITEVSTGTSGIAASCVDNDVDNQGRLEILGVYIIIFIVCLTTFLIIVTSNYDMVNFDNINGIEILLYAFNYHFGSYGLLFLSIVTILFAFSTIISCYYFGESNLLTNKKVLYQIIFMLVIFISCYVRTNILWNLTDYFLALLVIINCYAIIKISYK